MEPENIVTSSCQSSSTLQLRDEPSLLRLMAGFETTRVLVDLCAHIAKEQEALSLNIAESVSLQYLENSLSEIPEELPFIEKILLRASMYCLVSKDSSTLIDAVQQLFALVRDDKVKAGRLALAIDRSLLVLRHKITELLISSYSHSIDPEILRQATDTILSIFQPAIDLVNCEMCRKPELDLSSTVDSVGIKSAHYLSRKSAILNYLTSSFLFRHLDHSAIVVTLFFMTGYSIWSVRAGFFSASLGFLLSIFLRSSIQDKATPEF